MTRPEAMGTNWNTVLGDPAWEDHLDRMTSKGFFQPLPTYASVIVLTFDFCYIFNIFFYLSNNSDIWTELKSSLN